MNKISISLITIGIIKIILGLIIGIATNDLLFWLWIGIVSGVILFGLAEMINLLQQNRDIAREQLSILKGQIQPQTEYPSKEEDEESLEKDDGYDDLRKELQEQGHDREYIEATVAIRKRLGEE